MSVRVTFVRTQTTVEGGIEVEVTITREGWARVASATPDASDVPEDIRDALREWLGGAS